MIKKKDDDNFMINKFSEDLIDYKIINNKFRIEMTIEKFEELLKSWLYFNEEQDLLNYFLYMIINNFNSGDESWKEPFFKLFEEKIARENNYN